MVPSGFAVSMSASRSSVRSTRNSPLASTWGELYTVGGGTGVAVLSAEICSKYSWEFSSWATAQFSAACAARRARMRAAKFTLACSSWRMEIAKGAAMMVSAMSTSTTMRIAKPRRRDFRFPISDFRLIIATLPHLVPAAPVPPAAFLSHPPEPGTRNLEP